MAKRFQFRLETVQTLRQRVRDERRRAVAGAIVSLHAAARRVDTLSEQLRETVEITRGAKQKEHLDVLALRGQQFYRNWLHGKLLESDAAMAEKKAELERQRVQLADASARLKAIEKLRERRWKRHQAALRREEQAASDEAAQRIAGHGFGVDLGVEE